jgi:hypothetical protein
MRARPAQRRLASGRIADLGSNLGSSPSLSVGDRRRPPYWAEPDLDPLAGVTVTRTVTTAGGYRYLQDIRYRGERI